MLGLFKEITAAYLVSVVAGGIGILVFAYEVLGWAFLQSYLIVFLWALLCTSGFISLAQRKNKKVNKLLDDCDIENFLAIYQRLMGRKRMMGKETTRMVELNIIVGQLMLGESGIAGRLLGEFGREKLPGSRAGALHEFVYHNNQFLYLLNTGDHSGAAQALERMDGVLRNPKMPRSCLQPYRDFLSRQRQTLSVENGNYNGAEEFFAAAFESAGREMDRVSTQLMLGKIYLYQGRVSEAVGALEYVVQHGGSSIHRAKATERLEALGITIPAPPPKKPPVQVFSALERAGLVAYCIVVVAAALLAIISS